MTPEPTLLEIGDLVTDYHSDRGVVRAVEGASMSVSPGEVVALVGESGSGKSATALSALGLIGPPAGRIAGGRVLWHGRDLLTLDAAELEELRGREISMIFQDPMTSLNPVRTVGKQIADVLLRHRMVERGAVRARLIELLKLVGIPDPETRVGHYPFQFSGGMRQRVMIAMALACQPELLIADEPTTALDVTVQAQILDLIVDLQRRMGMAMLLITHDLGVVARVAHRVYVMRSGVIVESGSVEQILARPQHPYTRNLLSAARPAITDVDGGVGATAEVLRLSNLHVRYRVDTAGRALLRRRAEVRAVDDVSLTVSAGETLGLVGESGSGKSSLAKAVLHLTDASGGSIELLGDDVTNARHHDLRLLRRRVQMVFQDPYESLNPRMRVSEIISEPLKIHGIGDGASRKERVGDLLDLVGLDRSAAARYPHQFSGGQRQRIGIARALAIEPALVVCDEPVSALDVSVRAQVLELFRDLRQRLKVAYLFIAHDLGVVRQVSDRVAVMHLGQVVELGPAAAVFDEPLHPYTRSLVSAIPVLDPATERSRERIVLKGDPPSPINPPSGCRFRTRCPHARQLCAEEEPPLASATDGRTVACHFWAEIASHGHADVAR